MDTTGQTKYYVHWKYKLTGIGGRGNSPFPKDEAQRYADAYNERDKSCIYWIEEIPETEETR